MIPSTPSTPAIPSSPQPAHHARRRAGLAFALVVLLLVSDACQRPERQVMVYVGVGMITLYQQLGRPVVRHVAVCRYTPSCSEYGRLALRQYGFWPGSARTIARIARCRGSVPLGTQDDP